MHIVRAGETAFEELWRQLWQKDYFQHPFYLKWNIEWTKEVAEVKGSKFEDLSFVAAEDNRAVLGALMSVQKNPEGTCELGYFGRPVFYLESEDAEFSQLKQARKIFKEESGKILEGNRVTTVFYQDSLRGNNLSYFGGYLMDMGAEVRPTFIQIIDLSLSEEQLHQQIRKSYGSLINWGLRNLEITVFDADTVNKVIVEEFKQLHAEAAGRQTRSARSWQIQYEMVRNREAFIVLGRQDKRLVTAAFFVFSEKLCNYSSSASRRDMFDKPLAHSILWKAILQARNMGCRYFETGEQWYPNHIELLETVDEKVLQEDKEKKLGICKFKRGFGGTTTVRLNLRLCR